MAVYAIHLFYDKIHLPLRSLAKLDPCKSMSVRVFYQLSAITHARTIAVVTNYELGRFHGKIREW